MSKAVERVVIKETKTYIYYFNVEDEKLVYWLLHNKTSRNKNVCFTSACYNGRKGMMQLMVCYK